MSQRQRNAPQRKATHKKQRTISVSVSKASRLWIQYAYVAHDRSSILTSVDRSNFDFRRRRKLPVFWAILVYEPVYVPIRNDTVCMVLTGDSTMD